MQKTNRLLEKLKATTITRCINNICKQKISAAIYVNPFSSPRNEKYLLSVVYGHRQTALGSAWGRGMKNYSHSDNGYGHFSCRKVDFFTKCLTNSHLQQNEFIAKHFQFMLSLLLQYCPTPHLLHSMEKFICSGGDENAFGHCSLPIFSLKIVMLLMAIKETMQKSLFIYCYVLSVMQ